MKKNLLYYAAEITFLVFSVIIVCLSLFTPTASFSILIIYVFAVVIMLILSELNRRRLRKETADETHKRILQLMDVVNSYVAIWTEDKKNLIMNDRLKSVLGNIIADKSNREIIDFIFPQTFITHTKADMMLSDTRELPLKLSADNILYAAWKSAVLFYNSEGNRYIISIGFDVTENKEIRQQLNITNNLLAASERQYSLAMGLSEIGIILNEHCEDTFKISKELRKMLGLSDDRIRVDDFIKLIHRDERMPFETYLKAARGNNMALWHTSSMDMRILSADRTYKWYSFRYKNIQTGRYGMPIIGGAIIDISKDKEKDALIEQMAYVDDITGIYNRNKLMMSGQEMYECCKILDMSYWIIVFDIDRFHIMNDTCGYDNGNKLLRDFADILYKHKRKSGFAARVGGDNFVLIVQDYGDDNYPRMIINEIQSDMDSLGDDHMFKQSLSCSAGYSKMPDDGEDFITVFERAEFALSTGDKRNAIVRYDSSVHDTIIRTTALEKSLEDAINEDELELFYQPKVEIKTGKIIGVEALIRWIKPNGEIISPDEFVPVAENSHLITKIGEYVVKEACMQNKTWQNMGLPNIIMSINLTSEDFYQKNMKEYIGEILTEVGLAPEWFEIELTESLAMKDIDFAVQQMQELRDMGLKLAMDDFGTGYSSLSYIQKMPIGLLKLDRSFIAHLEDDLVAQEIVSAVIKIAKSKKIETIAEGTETEEQVEILEKLGCDYAQGYLFGKPMNAETFTEFFRAKVSKP